MPVTKPIELEKSGVHAEHLVPRVITIIADDPSNLRLIGEYMAYENAAAKAVGSGPVPGILLEVEVKNADLSPAVLSAIALVITAFESASVADAGVEAVEGVEAVKAVEADEVRGIEAAPAEAAVKAVPARPPGPLFGGILV